MITGTLYKLFPEAIRLWIRRRYYRRVVRRYKNLNWEWSSVVLPLIPEGGVVFDVGANVGYLSKLFAERVGPKGRVCSVEPIPDTHDSLRSSMQYFFPDTVAVYQCCVSDQESRVRMVVPSYEGGGENFYEAHIKSSEDMASTQRTFDVEAVSLDSLVERAGVIPDFIKIDVEGHELSVIRSGRSLLSKHQPPLLIEVAGNPDESTSQAALLFNELNQLGYTPHTLTEEGCRQRKQGDSAVDYLFLSGCK